MFSIVRKTPRPSYLALTLAQRSQVDYLLSRGLVMRGARKPVRADRFSAWVVHVARYTTDLVWRVR